LHSLSVAGRFGLCNSFAVATWKLDASADYSFQLEGPTSLGTHPSEPTQAAFLRFNWAELTVTRHGCRLTFTLSPNV